MTKEREDMSNQPYRNGAFEIPCCADGWVAETRVPEDRPLNWVQTWMALLKFVERARTRKFAHIPKGRTIKDLKLDTP